MRKIIPIIIFVFLVFSGIGASGLLNKIESNYEIIKYSESINFSEPIIKEYDNEYNCIDLKQANGYLHNIGEPIIPIFKKKITFPVGTQIKDVQISFSSINQYDLNKKIASTPVPVTKVEGINALIEEENDIYKINKQYPKKKYDMSLHAGLEKNKHVIIINLQCYPIHYNPVENKIYSAENLKIDIEYQLPKNPVTFPDEYDMVIIAPEKFSTALEPLITHKNNHGIQTTLKTTESIYDEFSGRDQPEKIKYFIYDALENWNISYVLLVGGKKSLFTGNWGIEGPSLPNDDLWHVPVRYNNLLDSSGEAGCLTDLYFSDIYKVEGSDLVFDDWDSDGNDIFAEWTIEGKDILDLYPDVHVGRLACRNRLEVKIMVNKIIKYEEEGCDPSWFNKIVGVGGDSFDDGPPYGDDYLEGEERNKLAFEYLSGFTPVKVWASNQGTFKPVPSTFHILRALNKGCGFVYFAGHGNPNIYNTHWFDDFSWNNTPGGINIYEMLRLHNGKKLPICVIGACHNNEFNVSFFNYLESPLEHGPTPECWSWMLTRNIGGGSIATIGYTGLEWVATYGWDSDDMPDCTQYYSGYIDSRFFYAYGVDGIDYLGEACSQAITEYLDTFPAMDQKWDCKTAQQWHLLGDPSLKIGGYS